MLFFYYGFTLFLGRIGHFDNWYKRRINRIYPTVLAWATLGGLLFSTNIIPWIIQLFMGEGGLSGRKINAIGEGQILSLIPLLGITFYFYKICNSLPLKKWYEHKISGWIIKFIGGLCLEIYLVQYSLFTDKMNSIFPLNLFIMFFIIVVATYILNKMWRKNFLTDI